MNFWLKWSHQDYAGCSQNWTELKRLPFIFVKVTSTYTKSHQTYRTIHHTSNNANTCTKCKASVKGSSSSHVSIVLSTTQPGLRQQCYEKPTPLWNPPPGKAHQRKQNTSTHTHIKIFFAETATRQDSNAMIATLTRDPNANPCLKLQASGFKLQLNYQRDIVSAKPDHTDQNPHMNSHWEF